MATAGVGQLAPAEGSWGWYPCLPKRAERKVTGVVEVPQNPWRRARPEPSSLHQLDVTYSGVLGSVACAAPADTLELRTQARWFPAEVTEAKSSHRSLCGHTHPHSAHTRRKKPKEPGSEQGKQVVRELPDRSQRWLFLAYALIDNLVSDRLARWFPLLTRGGFAGGVTHTNQAQDLNMALKLALERGCNPQLSKRVRVRD